MSNKLVFAAVLVWSVCSSIPTRANPPRFQLATFSADVTIPLGHRCMGVLPTKSRRIVDPLYVHGFVLLGAGDPIVLAALDWCEIRNGAYDQWRDVLADAVGTVRQRVLVCALHQHDAPVIDLEAARLLAEVDLKGELYDEAFHERTLQRAVAKVGRQVEAMSLGLARCPEMTHSIRRSRKHMRVHCRSQFV